MKLHREGGLDSWFLLCGSCPTALAAALDFRREKGLLSVCWTLRRCVCWCSSPAAENVTSSALEDPASAARTEEVKERGTGYL